MKSNPVVHFEMPAKDRKRVSDFYSKVFGWQMQQMGSEMGNYVLAQTTETDQDGVVKTSGNINGGFFEYSDKEGFQYPHVVIQVDNLEEAMKNVTDSGGQVMGSPMDIPGIGRYISFKDSEDNLVGMLQPT